MRVRKPRFGGSFLIAVMILGGFLVTTGNAGDSSNVRRMQQGTASLVTEVTIGAPDGAEEYLFTSIRNLLVASGSIVWVLDGPLMSGTTMLRQFDSEGSYLRHVGRQGAGPGEFEFPHGLAQLLDGRVLLRHGGETNRINVYLPSGSPDTTWTFHVPVPWYQGAAHSIQVDTSGIVWMSFLDRRGAETRTGRRPAYLRLRINGTIVDTVLTPELPPVDRESVTLTRRLPSGGTSTFGFAVPYQPVNIHSWSPLGFFATGQTGKYEIALHKPTRVQSEEHLLPRWQLGDPVVVVGRTIPPVAVSRAEREDQRSYLVSQIRARDESFSGSIPAIPRQKPAFKGVLFGEDGRIWVWVSMPSEQYDPQSDQTSSGQSIPAIGWREPDAFDVFESDGTFIGRIVLPYGIRLGQSTTWMKGNLIWCVVVDEDGAQVIRRYRVDWP